MAQQQRVARTRLGRIKGKMDKPVRHRQDRTKQARAEQMEQRQQLGGTKPERINLEGLKLGRTDKLVRHEQGRTKQDRRKPEQINRVRMRVRIEKWFDSVLGNWSKIQITKMGMVWKRGMMP
jgi:hypothetical protein